MTNGSVLYLVLLLLQRELSQQESSTESIGSERWLDPLAKALGNPEKSGRVRGLGVAATWTVAFPQTQEQARERKRSKKETLIEEITRKVQDNMAEDMLRKAREEARREVASLFGGQLPPLPPTQPEPSVAYGWSSCASANAASEGRANALPIDNITVSLFSCTNASQRVLWTCN